MKTKTREIPKKNYIIYSILVIFTIALTFLACNWYNINKDLNKKSTIMSSFLVSVNETEFENYVVENNNIIIYLASSKDGTLNNFEQKLKELLIRHDLKGQTIFIDLDSINSTFLKKLKNNYLKDSISNITIGNFPNILIMENGKISSVLYVKESIMNIYDVEQFFYNRGVIAQA